MKDLDMSRSEIESLVDEWVIGRNAERNRLIIKDRLIDGLTYEKLAEKYDLSTQNIKTIVYKCQDKIFRHI